MKSNRVMKMVLSKHVGEEPEPGTDIDNILKVLNFYSSTYDRKDAIKFFENYMSSVDPDFLDRRNYEKMSPTVGWVARLKTLECSLPLETEEWFKDQLNRMPVKLTVVPVFAPLSDPLHSQVIAEIEEKLDNSETDFSYLSNMNLSNSVINKVVKFFERRLDEINLIDFDDEVTEAYRGISEEEIQAQREGLTSILNSLGIHTKEVSKRGRKKKVRKPEDIVKNINLHAREESLGLKSLDATKILGSKILVFYVPKHRSLQIYYAEEGKSFDVKGKSVINFDADRCVSKAIRKPEISMPKFMTSSFRKIQKEFDALTTKPRPQRTALISNNHMLIAAFKE